DDAARALELGDAVVAGSGLAAERRDLLAHLGRGIGGGAAPGDVAADVVDHHLGALAPQREGDAAPDAPPRAGDHGDPALEELAHATSGVRVDDERWSANMRASRVSMSGRDRQGSARAGGKVAPPVALC